MNDFWVRRVWEHRGWGFVIWLLLLPLSILYCFAAQIRNLFYSLRLLPSRTLPCPVVSVGNLTVGGTGKTPTTLWLARELGRRGYKVAILSRGYKRSGKGTVILEPGPVMAGSDAPQKELMEAGDEPLMMARVFGQRVAVGKRRYQAAAKLLQSAPVDLFVLDDGFQYRRLRRDLDLLLLGEDRRGWLLPAGPFREPRRALRRAQLYLVTGSRERWQPFLARRPQQSVFFGSLQARCLLTLDGNQWKEFPLALLGRNKILTVSAIANPAHFYRIIHEWEGEIVDSLEFPDHHFYSAKDWQDINRAARNAEIIVTTEKDIMKLIRFPFAREKLLALRVEMVVEEGESLIRSVEEVIQKKKAQGKNR